MSTTPAERYGTALAYMCIAQRLGYRDQNLELFLLFFFFGIINFVFESQVPFGLTFTL